jgi:ferredoxin
LAEVVAGYTATTIPVHVEIAVDQIVLNLGEAEGLLRKANSIARGPCECRANHRRCSAPVDVCLTLNDASGAAVETRDGFRTVAVDEALAALRLSHEAGLVHLAYREPGLDATLFCSCCPCCCWFLSNLRRFDYHDAIVESSHAAEHDVSRCMGCGLCVTRCPFGAWTHDGEIPTLHRERCFGCGVCMSACPHEAIAFVPRTAAGSAS